MFGEDSFIPRKKNKKTIVSMITITADATAIIDDISGCLPKYAS